MAKVVLIGCGNVGMAYAFSLVNQNSHVNELVLVDINREKIEGEALDLMHAQAVGPCTMSIKAGDYSDCNDADIVCITAGRNQNIGETRMDLINKNTEVFKSIITEINKTNFKGIYLIATNPLDVMTNITQKISNFDKHKVIGSGTVLDSARLRYLVSQALGVNPKSVHGYVIGEHGDSEFIPFSNMQIGLNNISHYLNEEQLKKIEDDVSNSAYDIIKKKGNTSYGIGICLARLTNAILEDSRRIFTVSCYNEDYGLYIGEPAVIGREGIIEVLDLNLSKEDKEKLDNCAYTIEQALKRVNY